MKNISLLLFVSLYFSLAINAQSFEWVIPPKLGDYDEIKVEGQILKFVIVKKDGKYGVVSPKNKEIAPIEYKYISQVTEDYFSAHHEKNADGQVNTFFDEDGYTLDFEKDIKKPYDHEKTKKSVAKMVENGTKRITEFMPDIELVDGKYLAHHIISSSGDTIAKNVSTPKSKRVGEHHMYLEYFDKIYLKMLIDKDLNIVKSAKYINTDSLGNGSWIVDRNMLIDKEGKIRFRDKGQLSYLKDSDCYVIEDDKKSYTAYDNNFKQLFDKPYDRIYSQEINDVAYTMASNKVETVMYDPTSKKVEKLPYKILGIKNAVGHHKRIIKDSLSGIMDLATRKILLEPSYKYIEGLGNGFYLAANNRRTRKNRKFKFERSILNDQGEVVFNSINKGIRYIGSNYILLNKDSTSVILDENMNEVYSASNRIGIAYRDGYIMMKEDGKKKAYPLTSFLAGDKSLWFDAIPEAIKAKDEYYKFYMVSKNGKYGFIDAKHNVLHKFELDEVGKIDRFAKDHKGYFPAKKKGKWGILQRPTN